MYSQCFSDWVNQVSELTEEEVVTIDGKSICGSTDSSRPKSAVHMVSAYASDNRVCLRPKVVDAKSNEITTIPMLLELLTIKGCVVTIDTMGCQVDIFKAIIKSRVMWVKSLKRRIVRELFKPSAFLIK